MKRHIYFKKIQIHLYFDPDIYYIITMLNCKPMLILLFSFLFLLSCGDHALNDFLTCAENDCLFEENTPVSGTGWLASRENLSNIPQDIAVSNNSTGFPPSVNLENRFPPIGNQGQYGTCVAWATGYNLKTALNAIEKGWNSNDLSKTANQTSPKDLWFAIDNSQKSTDCNGTNFESALDALILKGAASLSSVPYSNMGNCSGSSSGNANNKLANYRKIAYNYTLAGSAGESGLTLENLKGYLAQGRPILFGAKLGERFMRWNNSSTISSDTYNDPNMQHAYHAMVLVGYDDSKEAFRVRNSWGGTWGDNGSIWVDYDFFLSSFMFVAFVAQNTPLAVQEEVKPDQLLNGYDLLASSLNDVPNPDGASPRSRRISYRVYNSGTEPILASQRWSVLYMYYNAFDASEYDIILEDYYTDEYGGEPGKYGDLPTGLGFWNNMDFQPGKLAGDGYAINYTMPAISGKFYLVIYADAYDAIRESNEDNNFYFLGTNGGKPLEFVNGVMQNTPANILPKTARHTPAKSVQEIGGSANAYTPQEIKALVSQSKKSGVLGKKIAEYRKNNERLIKLSNGNP